MSKTVAVIGLGNMGGPMAANLIKAGHKVDGFRSGARRLAIWRRRTAVRLRLLRSRR